MGNPFSGGSCSLAIILISRARSAGEVRVSLPLHRAIADSRRPHVLVAGAVGQPPRGDVADVALGVGVVPVDRSRTARRGPGTARSCWPAASGSSCSAYWTSSPDQDRFLEHAARLTGSVEVTSPCTVDNNLVRDVRRALDLDRLRPDRHVPPRPSYRYCRPFNYHHRKGEETAN